MATPDYHREALCGGHPDPDLWTYTSSLLRDVQLLNVYRIIEAKSICGDCPVKDACLKEGLSKENMEQHQGQGLIWGGLMGSERAEILKYSPTSKIIVNETVLRREVKRISAKMAQ